MSRVSYAVSNLAAIGFDLAPREGLAFAHFPGFDAFPRNVRF